MKRTFLTIWTCIIVVAIMVGNVQAADVQAGGRNGAGSVLAGQQDTLKHIEQEARSRRENIEFWYNSQLAEIRRLATIEAVRLDFSEKLLWSEFFMMVGVSPIADTYFTAYRPEGLFRDRQYTQKRYDMMNDYLHQQACRFLLDEQSLQTVRNMVFDRYQPSRTRQQAIKVLAAMQRLQDRKAELDRLKRAKLARLQRWIEQRKQLATEAKPTMVLQPRQPEPGVVVAISFDGDNSIAMVGEEIVTVGSKLGDVQVTRISPDRVEFARGRRSWSQQVGKPAGPAWQ